MLYEVITHLLGVDDAALRDVDVPELPETGHIDVTRLISESMDRTRNNFV